ncbi:hypothetical protein ACHAXR_011345 [Thalassiosira sp. AJA248-18]
MASATRSRDAPPQAQQQGNLGSVLTQFDHSHQQNPEQSYHAPGSTLTINVPGGGSTDQDGADRERSLTMGSEFDLGWGSLGKDGRGMSFSGLMTPLGEPADGMSEATSTTAISGSTSSTHNSTQAAPALVPSGGAVMGTTNSNNSGPATATTFAATFLPRLPENTTVPKPADMNFNMGQQTIPARARGDSTASQFLNGLYQQQLPQQHQPRSQNQMIAHTPPSQMGTSYENSHFGKRMRAGSISGRLRSASDLEDTGVISHEQKAILKDLIISGDNSVQGAIDKYEAGDPSALEEMIKSGALLARSSDVDLLGNLDLDFLNVHEDDGMMFGNMDDIVGTNNVSGGNGGQSGSNDGIGDLEFNGDFSAPTPVASNSQYLHKARGNSVDDLEVHRMRANSLALPGLLLDGANPEDVSQISFGRWMDKHVDGPPPHAMQTRGAPAQRQIAPNVVDVNGTRHILNPPQFSSECDVLMASKYRENLASAQQGKKPKAKKEKTKKTSSSKKEKKEPRERKSQSKMKDMMESMSSNNNAPTPAGDDEENKEVASGLGRPRSMSDPNLSVRLDDHGLLHVDGPEGWVGAYSPDSRQMRINRFLEKRNHRVWVKKVKYDVRKNFADSRLRVKGRFVKKEDEMLMRELMSLT